MNLRKLISAVFVTSVFTLYGAVDIDSINARLEHQRNVFPQEKFHIMTDQSQYMGGDTVWMRGFVVDAASHQPLSASKYLYVELRNPFDSIEQRIKLSEHNGIYAGYIPLDANIAEGEYTITAYTRYAQSLGQDYFFRKPINIKSPFSTVREIRPTFHADDKNLNITLDYIDRATGNAQDYTGMSYHTSTGRTREFSAGKGSRILKLSRDERNKGCVLVRYNSYSKYLPLPDYKAPFDVTFHPEGGYAVTDAPNRIAFKAIDTAGRGIHVTGRIVDSTGEEVIELTDIHRGMGSFVLIPQTGMTYTAYISDGTTELKFDLPEHTDKAPVLHVDNSRASVVCVATAGPVPSGSAIIGIQRGYLLFAAPANGVALNINKSEFANGILQIMLVGPDGNILSERLTFIRHDAPTSTLTSHLSAYLTRTNAKMSLNLEGYKVPDGNIAVAVTDDNLTSADSSMTITSQLLLQGDIRGHVEDAGYYFRHPSRHTDAALDALMMTQGWTRYDIPAVIHGNYSEPSTTIEFGHEITGSVNTLWRNKPMKDAAISVLAPKYRFADVVTSDENGRFVVDRLNFPEGTKFLLQALNQKGKGDVNFSIDSPVIPKVTAIPPVATSITDTIATDDTNHAKWRMMRNNGLMEILLDEISVTHRKTKEMDSSEYAALASKSFDREQLDKDRVMTYDAVIGKIGGLTQSDGVLRYHGNPVSYYVDGFRWSADETTDTDNGNDSEAGTSNSSIAALPTKLSDFEMMYPISMVSRSDFLQPAQALSLGNGNSGGALVIT
ncbi:MAG: hypothetical protein K2M65_00065, partial [Muribaculaceae bacterium]|nr:hypothetical protein [Muribaculaceae bacterium]